VPESKLVDAPYCVDNEFFRAEAGKMRGTRLEAGGEGGAQGAHFDRDNFDILKGQQRAIREEWKIPLAAKVVMFCGKFVGKKRPLDVVLAAQAHFDRGHFDNLKDELQSSRPWHLLFVGSGELGDELRAACDVVYDEEGKGQEAIGTGLGENESKRHEVRGTGKERARGSGQGEGGEEPSSLEPLAPSLARANARPPASFAGFLNQSQISKAYAVADVVVLPSEAWETWGLVVNEATAAGVPTVVSDQCGCSDDFAAKNPYTRDFPMGDVKAMARVIEEVLGLEAKPAEVTKFAEAFSPRITARAAAERLRTTELATDQHG